MTGTESLIFIHEKKRHEVILLDIVATYEFQWITEIAVPHRDYKVHAWKSLSQSPSRPHGRGRCPRRCSSLPWCCSQLVSVAHSSQVRLYFSLSVCVFVCSWLLLNLNLGYGPSRSVESFAR